MVAPAESDVAAAPPAVSAVAASSSAIGVFSSSAVHAPPGSHRPR